MLKLIISASIVALSLSGCGSAIGPIQTFKKVPLQKSSFMPSKEDLDGSKTKIVLTRIDDSSFKLASNANLGESLRIELENELASSGVVEVLDRETAELFDDEIRLTELQDENELSNLDDGTLSLPKYAISGKISNSGFNSTYYKRRCYTNKKGETSCTPSYYSYKASVDGILKIHEIPSMKVVKTIEFGDNFVRNEDSSYYGNSYSRVDTINMLNAAGKKAMYSSRVSLKNFFAQKGYVMEKRLKEDETILKISVGRLDGLSQGNNVNIYSTKESINPLTNEVEKSTFKVAEGMVSDKLFEHRAWIIITDTFNKVKLGDYVKVRYAKTLFE